VKLCKIFEALGYLAQISTRSQYLLWLHHCGTFLTFMSVCLSGTHFGTFMSVCFIWMQGEWV
jgi:hypothetical protein